MKHNLLVIITGLLFGFFGCWTDGTLSDDADTIFCPQVQQYLTPEQCSLQVALLDSQLCINQPTGLKASYDSKYKKTPKVYHFTYNLPGTTATNCDFKFLEASDFSADSIELVRWPLHNVGNALYKVWKIDILNANTSKVWYKQYRETFSGVYNNDGICDGGSNPAMPNFYIRHEKCSQYAAIGDSFGLKKIVHN